jgi:hypothetical protein
LGEQDIQQDPSNRNDKGFQKDLSSYSERNQNTVSQDRKIQKQEVKNFDI